MRLQLAVTGLVGAACLLLTAPAFGAQITKISGRKVLMDLQGDAAKEGDIFVVLSPEGKKKALVKIKTVKNGKAIGVIGKGKAEAGWSAKISEKSGGAKTASGSGEGSRSRKAAPQSSASREGKSYWGLMGGIAMDTMSVDIDNTGDSIADKTVDLDGMAFSAKALFDYELFPQVWFRGLGGLEGLNVSGPTEVGCQAKACSVSIYYLSVDFWARYAFSTGSFRPWAGAAFSLMFPATKDATALEDSSITNTSAISVGIGFDWFTSETFYIPIQIEYAMLPKSETVEASAIGARIGFALPF